MDNDRTVELLDARKRWTQNACESCSVCTGPVKIGVVDARRHYEHKRQSPQKLFYGRCTPILLPPRTPDANPIRGGPFYVISISYAYWDIKSLMAIGPAVN